jgi:Domain of unknown function (DUF5664)
MKKVVSGKPDYTLIYRSLMDSVARVRLFGAIKYKGRNSWRASPNNAYIEAALRHIFARLDKEIEDKESGEHHLAHAIANLMFVLERDTKVYKRKGI